MTSLLHKKYCVTVFCTSFQEMSLPNRIEYVSAVNLEPRPELLDEGFLEESCHVLLVVGQVENGEIGHFYLAKPASKHLGHFRPDHISSQRYVIMTH